MLQNLRDKLTTTAVDFKPPHTTHNGNGHAHGRVGNGGNGHRRVRHQIHHGYRRTALKADTAVILVENGMDVTEAIERLGISTNAFTAMRALRESGNVPLHDAVLHGGESLLDSGARMKNAAAAITALRMCSGLELELVRLSTGSTSDATTMLLNMSSELLTETATELGSEWIWENLVMRAMSSESITSTSGIKGDSTEPVTVEPAD